MAEWKTLTRDDLRAFDTDQTKAVLYAMENGGVGRISNNGHAIIRNSQGQTMSVSRSAGGRSGRKKQNVAADLCRLFGAPTSGPPRNGALLDTMQRREAAASVALDGETQALDAEPTLACPAKKCDAQFVTEGARYQHVEQRHYKCTEPGCDYVGLDTRALTTHRRRAHEGWNPAKGKSKKTRNGKPVARRPKARPVQTVQPSRASGLVPAEAPYVREVASAVATVDAIRELLGEDPRIADLRREVDRLARERDDALAQLSLVREALHLNEAS